MSIEQMTAVTVGRRGLGAASSTLVEATISLVAGRGVAGYLGDGARRRSRSSIWPTGVAIDAAGGILVVDASNRVRRIAYGTITTIAGSGVAGHVTQGYPLPDDGGPATEALLNFPTEVLLDGEQSPLIADSSNGRVRRVDRDGIITTIAGGGSERPADGLPAASVSLAGGPTGMAFDGAGNLLVCEEYGHRVWRLTPMDG